MRSPKVLPVAAVALCIVAIQAHQPMCLVSSLAELRLLVGNVTLYADLVRLDIIHDVADDDTTQRNFLDALFSRLSGPGWFISQPENFTLVKQVDSDGCQTVRDALSAGDETSLAQASFKFPWQTAGISYCNWYGVTCCRSGMAYHAYINKQTDVPAFDGNDTFQAPDAVNPIVVPNEWRRLMFQSSPNSHLDLSMLYPACSQGTTPHQVVALMLQRMNLVGSLPEDFEPLRELKVLDVSRNPGLVATLPRRIPSALSNVDISGTSMTSNFGLSMVKVDSFGDVRYQINGIMVANADRNLNITLSSNVPDLMTLEYEKARLLFQADSADEAQVGNQFDPTRVERFPDTPRGVVISKIPAGMGRVGTDYGEVVPAWFMQPDNFTSTDDDDCAVLGIDEETASNDPYLYSQHTGAFNDTIICRRPIIINQCSGSIQHVATMMHPVYHGFHANFCSCLDSKYRLGFLQGKPVSLLQGAPPQAAQVFVACIPRVDSSLYQNWVFLPGIIYLLVNVLLVIAQRNDRLRAWIMRRFNPYKPLKRKNHPGLVRFDGKSARLIHPGESWSEVTLVMTDVEGSTAIWEWNSVLMNIALSMHDKLIRSLIDAHDGFEVTTEGDAFIIAFHEPHDALAWCLHLQEELLNLDWDPAVLMHEHTTEVTIKQLLTQYKERSPHDAKKVSDYLDNLTHYQKDKCIFRGLRVRMAVHTDVPDGVHEHAVTGRMEYYGSIRRFTEELTNFSTGGQVILSGAVFGRLQIGNGMWYAANAFEDALSRSKRRKRANLDQKRFVRQMMALKEALGWQELNNQQTILWLNMGSVPLTKAPMPQSLTLMSVVKPDALHINNVVSWDHLAMLFQAVAAAHSLRVLHFKASSIEADIMRVGFFRAPGCLEYLLGQKLPFCASMYVTAVWQKEIKRKQRHEKFFKCMLVQCSTIYRGYVSEVNITEGQMMARVLFSLPEECIAAAVTINMAFGAMLGHQEAYEVFDVPPAPPPSERQRKPGSSPPMPPVTVKIGIAGGNVDVHYASTGTARMVIVGEVARQSAGIAELGHQQQILVETSLLRAAFPGCSYLIEEDRKLVPHRRIIAQRQHASSAAVHPAPLGEGVEADHTPSVHVGVDADQGARTDLRSASAAIPEAGGADTACEAVDRGATQPESSERYARSREVSSSELPRISNYPMATADDRGSQATSSSPVVCMPDTPESPVLSGTRSVEADDLEKARSPAKKAISFRVNRPASARLDKYASVVERVQQEVANETQLASYEALASSADPADPAPAGARPCVVATLDRVPTRQYVLNGKFLGRFFMRNSKEASTIATVYPQIHAHLITKHLGRLAEITKISEPKHTRDFKLIEMNLKDAELVLAHIINNVLSEEKLSRACADKKRI